MAAMEFLLVAVGWLGAGLLLFGYAMVSSSRLSGESVAYQLINLGGSLGLMINSAVQAAWPSAVLNLIWAAIGVTALFKLYRIGLAR
ncbi:hypothetical protein GCM10009560_61250 [Nonomuraea longicatena]|uniref:CBU-0592-like domain-containing protein n=2 Tax=Nonomuraea longicatena TaxID=83682 RepID=A0ABN1QQF3_9ACTN